MATIFPDSALLAVAPLEKGPYAVKKEADLATPMRDGTVLLADVYRPQQAGSYPVLLMRLPYDKTGHRPPSTRSRRTTPRTVTSS
jgi:predicted acyl esterase